MKQFSEEHLEKMQDRLAFLEYTMKFAVGTANSYPSNSSQRQSAIADANAYKQEVSGEVFQLRTQIAALDSFLDIQHESV
jgi:hypothetical protein